MLSCKSFLEGMKMQALFLFYTQGEAGAPDYLSRTGEQGAESFAETITSFLSESLQIELVNTYAVRAKSLNEDVKWRSFKEQSVFPAALEAALQLCGEVLIVAGSDFRTLKTSEVLAKALALPICVENRFDKFKDSKPYIGNLTEALDNLLLQLKIDTCPKVVLVGTSCSALLEWISTQKNADELQQFAEILRISSENDTIPAVFIAGMSKEHEKIGWVMDLPKITD